MAGRMESCHVRKESGMENRAGTRLVWVSAVAMLATWAASGLCLGQAWSRTNKLEFAGGWCFLAGADATVGGVPLSEDDWTLVGVNLGLNSARWNVNTDILYGSIDVEGRGPGVVAYGDHSALTWLVNLEYNLLKEPLTPFVTGGVGYVYSSGDFTIESGEDPPVVQDIDSTDFIWSLGAGARWDLSEQVFIKLLYRAVFCDGEDRQGLQMRVGLMWR